MISKQFEKLLAYLIKFYVMSQLTEKPNASQGKRVIKLAEEYYDA